MDLNAATLSNPDRLYRLSLLQNLQVIVYSVRVLSSCSFIGCWVSCLYVCCLCRVLGRSVCLQAGWVFCIYVCCVCSLLIVLFVYRLLGILSLHVHCGYRLLGILSLHVNCVHRLLGILSLHVHCVYRLLCILSTCVCCVLQVLGPAPHGGLPSEVGAGAWGRCHHNSPHCALPHPLS